MHVSELVETSNKTGMSGVDLANQIVYYFDRISKGVSWYKVALLMLDIILIFNVHVLNLRYGSYKDISLLKFCKSVIKTLIQHQIELKATSITEIFWKD